MKNENYLASSFKTTRIIHAASRSCKMKNKEFLWKFLKLGVRGWDDDARFHTSV